MKYTVTAIFFSFLFFLANGQSKKPLDHSVYDSWQSVVQPQLSAYGKWVVYQVNPQEGDGELVIQSSDGQYKKAIPRGYASGITQDSRYVIFRIKPLFKETRDARIKKKKPDEMPKDSLGIVELGQDSVYKTARIKSFKTPDKAAGWLALLLDKTLPPTPKPVKPDTVVAVSKVQSLIDSLNKVADSLKQKIALAQKAGSEKIELPKKPVKQAISKPASEPVEEGTDLIVRNTKSGKDSLFKLVSDYGFNKYGNSLYIKTTKKNEDTTSQALLLVYDLVHNHVDTVMKGFNDVKNIAFDEKGLQLACVAERDSTSKSIKKFYKLWYYKTGMDSAVAKASLKDAYMKNRFTVSPDYIINFSKDGSRLFYGISPIRQPKDTTLYDFETARLDVWHYNDDDLQPRQLVNLQNDLKKSYVCMVPQAGQPVVLTDSAMEFIEMANEGNSTYAIGETTNGYRVQNQWDWSNKRNVYKVDVNTGARTLVATGLRNGASISPAGKFIYWYDWTKRGYYAYEIETKKTKFLTASIKLPLYDEEDDHPDDPPPHGIMGWLENDEALYMYDKYDIWQVDPNGIKQPILVTKGIGRNNNITYRYITLDREINYLKKDEPILLQAFDNKEKGFGWATLLLSTNELRQSTPVTGAYSLSPMAYKADSSSAVLYIKSAPQESPAIVVTNIGNIQDVRNAKTLSTINPQQAQYNWYTVELHTWKMLDGKESQGLLYKPENFDPNKKYPLIFYFYERNSGTRYAYKTPAPSASTVNIAYFTSNGYLVFDPDIYYKNGEPGASAYNAIMSAANYLAKFKFVDSNRMAIQGQSWGGYQVAYLVTRTGRFAAAGAGAPVSDMFSAYGGIRWGTGMSRQAQYEKSQSRIGFTPWQRPDLYIKNSPLFKADKVTTPLLIMHNDKDGAVPWYQGIEYFTALRRNGKKVWMLQYNDEDHNLVERRNRKDLSIRLSQFFGHYLKGEPMPRWMSTGVPATDKGIDWGLK